VRITAQVDHSFRSKSPTDSDPSRPPIPTMSTTDSGDVDHPFRPSRPLIPVMSTTGSGDLDHRRSAAIAAATESEATLDNLHHRLPVFPGFHSHSRRSDGGGKVVHAEDQGSSAAGGART
jgi:hypothetical protein